MPRISNIEMLKQREQAILFVRKRINMKDMPVFIGGSFSQMGEYLKEHNEMLTDNPFVAYFGYENLDENDAEVMVAFPISTLLPEKGDIGSIILPEGKILFCYFRGDYQGMIPVYEEMAQYINNNRLESAGVAYEYYYNGQDYPLEEMLTKVVIPLK